MQEQVKTAGKHNPFTKMWIIKFCAISTIVYLTFPVSIIVSYIAVGPIFNKQLVIALVQDFLQILLVAIGVLIFMILGNLSLSRADGGWMVWRVNTIKD